MRTSELAIGEDKRPIGTIAHWNTIVDGESPSTIWLDNLSSTAVLTVNVKLRGG